MLVAAVAQAVYDRIKADNGSSGFWNTAGAGSWRPKLAGGAWFIGRDPTSAIDFATTPFLVFSLSSVGDDTFTSDREDYSLTFTVYDYASRGSTFLPDIIDRLHGDAMLQAGRVPSYGFHNHLLVLPTNAYSGTAAQCLRTTVSSGAVDSDLNSMSVTFLVSTNVNAVSP